MGGHPLQLSSRPFRQTHIVTPTCCVTLFKPLLHSEPQFLHQCLPNRLLGRVKDFRYQGSQLRLEQKVLQEM